MKFSDRFKMLREESGITQKELAGKLNDRYSMNLSAPTVSYWETGREPSYDVLIKVAEFFNCSVDYLLGVTEFRNRESFESNNVFLNSISDVLSESSTKIQNEFKEVINILIFICKETSYNTALQENAVVYCGNVVNCLSEISIMPYQGMLMKTRNATTLGDHPSNLHKIESEAASLIRKYTEYIDNLLQEIFPAKEDFFKFKFVDVDIEQYFDNPSSHIRDSSKRIYTEYDGGDINVGGKRWQEFTDYILGSSESKGLENSLKKSDTNTN